jgi:hypothetical protein
MVTVEVGKFNSPANKILSRLQVFPDVLELGSGALPLQNDFFLISP